MASDRLQGRGAHAAATQSGQLPWLFVLHEPETDLMRLPQMMIVFGTAFTFRSVHLTSGSSTSSS